MSLHKMVDAHPQVQDKTEDVTLAARQAMLCSLSCTSCAIACVAEDRAMTPCIRNCLDCADVCAATARLAVRRTAQNIDLLRAQMKVCIMACETCAEECAGHDAPHCQVCAKMFREYADDCRNALSQVK